MSKSECHVHLLFSLLLPSSFSCYRLKSPPTRYHFKRALVEFAPPKPSTTWPSIQIGRLALSVGVAEVPLFLVLAISLKIAIRDPTYQTMLNCPGGSKFPPVKASKAPSLKSCLGRPSRQSIRCRQRIGDWSVYTPRWFSSQLGQVSATVATTTVPWPLFDCPPPELVI